MSAGNPILKTRLPQTLADAIEADLKKHNEWHAAEEWTVSDWLRAAAREFLRKRRAGRTRRRSTAAPSAHTTKPPASV